MAGVVRIQGLVRLAERVRGEIGRGVSPDGREKLRRTVAGALGQVDEVLRARRAKVGSLAPPSRKAYKFLAGIRWEQVPAPDPAARSAPDSLPADGDEDDRRSDRDAAVAAQAGEGQVARLRWAGLRAFVDRLLERLAAGPGESELAEIERAIEQTSARIEGTIRREAIAPERLTPATRELRGWLGWMASDQALHEYLSAVRRARAALEAARSRWTPAEPGTAPPELVIEFRPLKLIYKMRTRAGRARVSLPVPMVRFDDATLADLGELVFARTGTAKGRVVERMKSEPYADLADELEALGGLVESTRGAVFDLVEVFDRVNAAYFAGAMPRPRLSWSRTMTRRKFGHYDHVRDWVMVSSTLDQPHVPPFVVDFLMFHELLHKKHGVRWVNGRGMAHTAAFYADEKRFDRHAEAEAWLSRLARS